MASRTVTHTWRKFIYFLHKSYHSLLALGTLNNISALHLETISNSKITKKITKKMQKIHDCEKDTCIHSENWNKKVGSLCSTSAGNVCFGWLKYFATINVVMHIHYCLQQHPYYWLGGYKSVLAVREFTNIESTNIEY